MTKYVTFNDRNIDTRTLGPADLEKAGVEGFEETTFRHGQPLEVKVRVANALIKHPELFGDFSIDEDITEAEMAEADAQAAVDKAAAESEAAAEAARVDAEAAAAQEAATVNAEGDPASGTSQESVSPPRTGRSGRGSTGTGTSGRGSTASTP
jgi:membrane protein involved in colicin uptake